MSDFRWLAVQFLPLVLILLRFPASFAPWNRIFKPIAEDEMLGLRGGRGSEQRLQTTKIRISHLLVLWSTLLHSRKQCSTLRTPVLEGIVKWHRMTQKPATLGHLGHDFLPLCIFCAYDVHSGECGCDGCEQGCIRDVSA
jgi:hypothetical protein